MRALFDWAEGVSPSRGGAWEPIDRGGSDRSFWRGRGTAAGRVAVAYGAERAENGRYAACAEFLGARGIRVPQVLAHDEARRFLLLEDAGEEDLWARRADPWPERGALYRRALEQAAAMHACPLDEAAAAGILQAPFDEKLYRWEQDYFAEHFLRAELSGPVRPLLAAQAEALAALPRALLHRDLQSQNIMLGERGVSLIDFQGMRAGLPAYDVASLLFDPYVPMDAPQREDLSDAYAGMAGIADRVAWREQLRACARQRLMQALGAYGFLGRAKGKTHFLRHIPVAADRLAALCEEEPAWRALADEVRRAAAENGKP